MSKAAKKHSHPGRPKMPLDKKRVNVNTMVAPETYKYLETTSRALKKPIGYIIDQLVSEI